MISVCDFVQRWKTENSSEEISSARPDLIVPISYTTLRDQLTIATSFNCMAAAMWTRRFPEAYVAFSSCHYPFREAASVEDRLRTEICRHYGVTPLIAKPMGNTVDEAMNIRDALSRGLINPRCILITTGELHSRSARTIWRRLFPKANVLIHCSTPYTEEIQPDHIVLDQRVMSKWVWSNIKREAALQAHIPLGILRKIQHKAAHEVTPQVASA